MKRDKNGKESSWKKLSRLMEFFIYFLFYKEFVLENLKL